MDTFIRASAGVLLAVILSITLRYKGGEISVLLSLAVCVMVGLLALRYLEPVIAMLRSMQIKASINGDLFSLLLKIIGVGLICELVTTICADVGSAAMGKVLQVLGVSVVLYLSIPLFEALLSLLEDILGYI